MSTFFCAACGSTSCADDGCEDIGGELVCDECGRKYLECSSCGSALTGTLAERDDLSINDRCLCTSCLELSKSCHHCGLDLTETDYRGGFLAADVFGDTIFLCRECWAEESRQRKLSQMRRDALSLAFGSAHAALMQSLKSTR